MATYNATSGQAAAKKLSNDVIKVENIIRLGNLVSGGPQNLDVVQALLIPDDCVVQKVGIIIKNPDGTATSINVGITGATTNGFDGAVDLTTAAGTGKFSTEGIDAYAPGYVNTTDGETIDILMQSNSNGAGVIYMYAICHTAMTNLDS